ncbi:MAG: hypothetical protein LBQ01_01090 [Prevotellaceae bacterium]|jgi:hypothetical protein|nr:hypothetical protein [Prevotellaceae bacterium]
MTVSIIPFLSHIRKSRMYPCRKLPHPLVVSSLRDLSCAAKKSRKDDMSVQSRSSFKLLKISRYRHVIPNVIPTGFWGGGNVFSTGMSSDSAIV